MQYTVLCSHVARQEVGSWVENDFEMSGDRYATHWRCVKDPNPKDDMLVTSIQLRT